MLVRRLFTQGQYFINAPNRNQRDLMEFMLWDKKAKQLGIGFATDDVKRLIQAEFMNQFKDDSEVRKILQKDMPGFTLEGCLDAIGAEFRVRACQTALLRPGIPRGGVERCCQPPQGRGVQSGSLGRHPRGPGECPPAGSAGE